MIKEKADFGRQLTEAVEQNRLASQLAAFRYHLEETETLSGNAHTPAVKTQQVDGQLTLIWQDGSVSLHRLTRDLLCADALPLDEWREHRFFHDGYRYFVKPSTKPLPFVPLYDPLIVRAVEENGMPALPDGFTATLSVKKRTVVHSKGLQLNDEETSIHLASKDPSYPFGFHSRLFPSEQESDYMATEHLWFSRFPMTVSEELDQVRPETILLFAPDAFRSLVHSGLGVHLTKPEALPLAHRFLDHCAQQTSLTLRCDPHVAWGPGSYRFSPEGNRTKAVTLLAPQQTDKPAFLAPHDAFEHKQAPGPSYRPESLHVSAGRSQRFREWIKSKPDVIYIPSVSVPETFSPFAQETAWVAEAFLFKHGRPVCRGPLTLPFSLASILCATEAELVSKIGWDAPGFALPARLLDSTS